MQITIKRDAFGALVTSSVPETTLAQAKALIAQALAKKKLPVPFDDMEWYEQSRRRRYFRGTRREHEIYDIATDGSAVLLCVREVEGDKHGQKTTGKDYFIVKKHGRGASVSEAPKATSAKISKQCPDLGMALKVLLGKAKLPSLAKTERLGFKVVRRNDDGQLVSVWDGSEWALGVARREASTPDHSGGFYYYANAETAIAAAEKNEVFGKSREHHNLVLLKVRVLGREYEIGHGKRCATEITPLEVVRNL